MRYKYSLHLGSHHRIDLHNVVVKTEEIEKHSDLATKGAGLVLIERQFDADVVGRVPDLFGRLKVGWRGGQEVIFGGGLVRGLTSGKSERIVENDNGDG